MPPLPLAELPGIGDEPRQRLVQAGLRTTADLLHAQRQRPSLAADLGLTPREFGKLLALARLAEIPGVGPRYCGVLLHIGISTPQNLAQSRPEQLQASILRLHRQLGLSREQCPGGDTLRQWVAAARRYR